MKKHGEKRYIPGTNPEWNRELPEGYDNSLVDSAGHNWDNGYNFDEKSDDSDEITYERLADKVKFDPEAAKKAKEAALKKREQK